VAVDRGGRVTVVAGSCSLGQGIETALTQVCAERLGVGPSQVAVLLGDTAELAHGGGSFASRSAVAAGNAVALAASRVRERAVAVAAHFLEASPDDLELVDGHVGVRGTADRRIPLGALAEAASYPNLHPVWRWPLDRAYPWGEDPGLDASASFRPDFTFGYAAHAAVVEVDVETGAVAVQQYVIVHDSGRVLNPTIVDGQMVGAAVQGLGGALWEEIVHDESGQLVSGTLMDVALPRADQVPAFITAHLETPAPNPLGVKGAGEGGLIPVAPAIAAAIDDALSESGVFCDRTPITACRLWRAPRQSHERDG